VYRQILGALVLVVAGCCSVAPQAAADNPVCTQTWCTFLAPSRNLGCEMNYQRGSGIPDETYCQTDTPPQSVRMSTDGSFKTCTGDSCLGNAGEGTATLAYGQAASVGPFNCRSEMSGVTCTVISGRGFTISSAGINSVG
jgi:hypothetical protein